MSLDTALELIESVKDYRVLFVGETIVDEYHYVTALGKSPKEHLIPVLYHDQEVFRGGVIAAANHVRSFCKTVDICTGAAPVRKVRYVESFSNSYGLKKLFEVQYNQGHPSAVDGCFYGDYDVVVVADFGHGYITSDMIEKLCKMPYIAVAAQTNSSNIGYNPITKYPRADYIVVDEPEARLAVGDRVSPIPELMAKLALSRCNKIAVTHGRHGSYGLQAGKFIQRPAFPNKTLDTMGAGDAFFAVTAPMSKTGDIHDLLLIGNAAGAIKCEIPGHRESVTKSKLIDFLKTHDAR